MRILKHSCKKAMDGFTLAIGLGWKSGRLSGETFSLNIAIEGLKKTLKVGNWKENPNFQNFQPLSHCPLPIFSQLVPLTSIMKHIALAEKNDATKKIDKFFHPRFWPTLPMRSTDTVDSP